jgi:hypothetical protein
MRELSWSLMMNFCHSSMRGEFARHKKSTDFVEKQRNACVRERSARSNKQIQKTDPKNRSKKQIQKTDPKNRSKKQIQKTDPIIFFIDLSHMA